jgi:hypothetical protein
MFCHIMFIISVLVWRRRCMMVNSVSVWILHEGKKCVFQETEEIRSCIIHDGSGDSIQQSYYEKSTLKMSQYYKKCGNIWSNGVHLFSKCIPFIFCIPHWPWFVNSTLDRGEWLASRPGRFTPRERAPGTHWIGGWVGTRAVPSPRRESNPRIPIVQPVA